jgi:hypothetical protein
LSKEIQQELVEVFVGPVVIWLLVGLSNDIGRRKPKPFNSNVDTSPSGTGVAMPPRRRQETPEIR